MQLQTSGEEFRGSCPAWPPTMPCSDPFPQSALVKPSIPCPPLKKRTANHTAKDKPGEGTQRLAIPPAPRSAQKPGQSLMAIQNTSHSTTEIPQKMSQQQFLSPRVHLAASGKNHSLLGLKGFSVTGVLRLSLGVQRTEQTAQT